MSNDIQSFEETLTVSTPNPATSASSHTQPTHTAAPEWFDAEWCVITDLERARQALCDAGYAELDARSIVWRFRVFSHNRGAQIGLNLLTGLHSDLATKAACLGIRSVFEAVAATLKGYSAVRRPQAGAQLTGPSNAALPQNVGTCHV